MAICKLTCGLISLDHQMKCKLSYTQHPDPDYSCAYVVIQTDRDLEGHGFTFTIGRGTDIGISIPHSLIICHFYPTEMGQF